MKGDRRKSNVALLSVVSNTALVVLKLTIGTVTGSVSIISEAIHSGVDLLAAVIAFFAVSNSSKPADKEHPFGHGKVENISGTIEALLVFAAAGWIIWESVKKLAHPQPLESIGWGVGVMLISALTNIFISGKLFQVGRETDSVALQADAWHLRTDVYTSAGVMAGLGIMWLTNALLPDFEVYWVDPLAAIFVALLIIKAAYHLTVESARDLLDVSLPPQEEKWIRDYLSSIDSVKGYHRLRTRKAGSDRFVELHLLVSPDMSVGESHKITEEINRDIQDRYTEQTVVTIHIEPCDGACTPDCAQHNVCNNRETV